MFGGGSSSKRPTKNVFVTDEEFAILTHMRNDANTRDAPPQRAIAPCIRPFARNDKPRHAPPDYEACQSLLVARNAQVAASRLSVSVSVSMPLSQHDVVYDNPHAMTLYALAVKHFQEQEKLRVQHETELDKAIYAHFKWHARTFGQSRACIDTEEILKQALQMAPEQAKQARLVEQAEQVVRDEQIARDLSLHDW